MTGLMTDPAAGSTAVTTARSTAATTGPTTGPTTAPAAELLALAHAALAEAAVATDPRERYAAAHLAALRAAAAVLASRARPAGRPRRPASAWAVLAAVAPELREDAAWFAAGAAKRAAAEAGAKVVTEREADDLVRDVQAFLARAARRCGNRHPAPRSP